MSSEASDIIYYCTEEGDLDEDAAWSEFKTIRTTDQYIAEAAAEFAVSRHDGWEWGDSWDIFISKTMPPTNIQKFAIQVELVPTYRAVARNEETR